MAAVVVGLITVVAATDQSVITFIIVAIGAGVSVVPRWIIRTTIKAARPSLHTCIALIQERRLAVGIKIKSNAQTQTQAKKREM